MSQNIISLRVPDAMKDRLDRLSASTRRSRSFLATEALNEDLERYEWQVGAIEEADVEADKGVFTSHDSVSDWLKSWGSPNVLPAPKADVFKTRS